MSDVGQKYQSSTIQNMQTDTLQNVTRRYVIIWKITIF